MTKQIHPQRPGPVTWLRLFIAIFGMLIVRQLVNSVWPNPTFALALIKEAGMRLAAGVLLVTLEWANAFP